MRGGGGKTKFGGYFLAKLAPKIPLRIVWYPHLKLLKSIFNLILGWLLVCLGWVVAFVVVLAWFDLTAFSNRCFISGDPAMIVLNGTGYFGPMLSSF
jgi:hypothetical protein